jgi:ElaB/YqjD/DUF883 family membrane-anchored ribosome-binding protein
MADDQNNASPPLTEQAKQQAQQAVQQGRQTAGHVWDLARNQFRAQLTGQKERAATSLDDFAQLIRQTGSQLKDQGHAGSSGYAGQIADKLSAVAGSVHEKEIEEILADTESFARQRPAIFLSLAALIGFLLARFLKSTGEATPAAA